jgi:CDP-diacylglycerol--glycerol-3-phosphate 3-phosphatidyltransferase/archaetidylinositol phosphate synthase
MKPVGAKLSTIGLTPNMITTASVIVSVCSGLAYAELMPLVGALGLVLSGFIDMLDGAVARATDKTTRFGAVYDHVLDRYAEFFVLVGIGIGGLVNWVIVIFCLFGMIMASFTRAKAESVGGLKSCTVGIAERQEKIILLLIGSILQSLNPYALSICVVIVGILSHITVMQRLHFTFKNARNT